MNLKILFILYLCIRGSLSAITSVDIRNAWQKGNYQDILGMEKRYPSLFQTARESALLAQVYYKLQQADQAAKFCAFSMKKQQNRPCSDLLETIRKEDGFSYEYGIGQYWLSQQQFEPAMIKFYKAWLLDEENTENLSLLGKSLSLLGQDDYVHDLLELSHIKTQELEKTQKNLDSKRKRLEKYFSKIKDLKKENPENLYLKVVFTSKGSEEEFKTLRDADAKHFEKKGFSQRLALREARYLFLESKIDAAITNLNKLEPRIVEPIHKLGLLLLKKRMAEKKQLAGKKNITEIQKPAMPITASTMKNPPSIPMDLNPLDLNDAQFATADNHQAFSKIYKDFSNRIENATEYEKRFLFKQIDQTIDRLEENETSKQALDSYLKTAEGADFREKMTKIEAEIEKRDQQNATIFSGELNRFTKDMSSCTEDRQKMITFTTYISKWDHIANGDDVDLVAQGALNAYKNTKEGTELAKKVFSYVQEFKLLPRELIDEEMQREITDLGF